MGKVIAGFSMSLDGFIAGPDDDVQRILQWYGSGDTEFPVPGMDMVFMISKASADLLAELWPQTGAIVTGRRDFDVSGAWGGKALLGVPMFIITHHPPQEWLGPDSPFTFVTEGVAPALEQAKQAAGHKNIVVSGSTIVQQCLQAGLLDEVHIDLVPLLLGAGIRLFDNLGPEPIDLEKIRVVDTPDVTHLHYRVIKGN